jgi:cell division protein FtsW
MRRTPSFDMTLFLSLLVLVGVGITFIYSASYPKAMSSTDTGGYSFFYALRQIIFAVVGLGLMFAAMFIPLQLLRRWFWGLIGITIAVLLAVLVFAADKHGNRNFMDIGPIQFQPSEFAKIAIVITLATYLSSRPRAVRSWNDLKAGPIWFVIVPFLLILAEKDLGMTFAITLSTTLILLIAGMKFRWVGVPLLLILVLGGIGLGMFSAANRLSHGRALHSLREKVGPRFDRILAWINPMDETNPAAYHPRNSLVAIGSGGWVGRGFCQSRQKWFYLPAPHNDYIAAVISEEVGFVGVLLLILVPYGVLIFRGFSIAHCAIDEFSALLAAGCTVMLASSAMVNLMVATNMIPSMGLNLPFVSYGGTSLLASMVMGGLLLNVSMQQPVAAAAEAAPAPA